MSGTPGSMQTRSPGLRSLTSSPDCNHNAGSLVAEHHGLLHYKRTDASVRVVVDVTAADAYARNSNRDVSRTHLEREFDLPKR